jgi:hypothetical protein
MKNLFIGIAGGVLLLLLFIWFSQPSWIVKPDNRKPALSLPDIVLSKWLSESDTTTTAEDIKRMVQFDHDVYMAFYNDGEVSKKYFYARNGSCCPCRPGGMKCCDCPRASALAAPAGETKMAMASQDNSIFRLASMQSKTTLSLDATTEDGVDVFKVPDNIPPGTYTVIFMGTITVTLTIEIDEKGNIKVTAVQ